MDSDIISSKFYLLKIGIKRNCIDIYNYSNEDSDKNSPFGDLIEEFTDIEKDKLLNLEIEIPKIFYFLLLNKTVVHQILYDKDKVIFIKNSLIGNNFNNYFYLVKLIEAQKEIVNYEYDYDVIKNLINQKGKFYDKLYTKILKVLISNYTEFKENIPDEINKEINSLQLEDIELEDDIDKIYIHLIIDELLESGKIEERNEEDEKFVKDFIHELDLENIEMTKTMYKELVEYFNKKINEDRYNIYDLNNINFYYTLFKYILKNSFYIYQIDFLLKLRDNILNIIRNENEEFVGFIPNNERFKYVINFLLDSPYYYDKIIEPKLVNKTLDENDSQNSSFDNPNKEKLESSSLAFQNQYSAYINNSENLPSTESDNILSSFEILKYKQSIPKTKIKDSNIINKKIIEQKDENDNYTFLEIDSNEVISSDKNYTSNKGFICLIKSKIGNLIVFDHFDKPTEVNNTINYKSKYFKLTDKSDSLKNYQITGAVGLLGNYYEKDNNDKSKYIRLNFMGGRKIMDNVYAFVSNKIYDHGENMLVILDFLNQSKTQIIPGDKKDEDKYSFNIGNNSLYLINADKDDKYKILLCSCKSYVEGTKNGILMVLMEINNQDLKTFHPQFYPTDDFEVNCFLSIDKSNDIHYILVGGFEVGKRRGNVKLYRLSCNIQEEKPEIEYIQDAIENFGDLGDFDGMINSMVKFKENDIDKRIKISCINGDDYIFELPINNDYIKFYESF